MSLKVRNRIFVLPLNDFDNRRYYQAHYYFCSKYYLPSAKIEYYNAMIDAKSFFGQSINNYIKTYENIRKNRTGEGDD